MAITNAQFLRPNGGRLSTTWFPGETLTDLVDAWITTAEALTTSEEAQAAWVYHLAFTALADSLYAEPAQQREGPKADAYLEDQLRYWREQAQWWKAEYDRLTTNYPAGSVLQPWSVAGTSVEGSTEE